MGGSGVLRQVHSNESGIGDHPDSAGCAVEMALIGSLTDRDALHLAGLGIHPHQIVCCAGWVRIATPHRTATGPNSLA